MTKKRKPTDDKEDTAIGRWKARLANRPDPKPEPELEAAAEASANGDTSESSGAGEATVSDTAEGTSGEEITVVEKKYQLCMTFTDKDGEELIEIHPGVVARAVLGMALHTDPEDGIVYHIVPGAQAIQVAKAAMQLQQKVIQQQAVRQMIQSGKVN